MAMRPMASKSGGQIQIFTPELSHAPGRAAHAAAENSCGTAAVWVFRHVASAGALANADVLADVRPAATVLKPATIGARLPAPLPEPAPGERGRTGHSAA